MAQVYTKQGKSRCHSTSSSLSDSSLSQADTIRERPESAAATHTHHREYEPACRLLTVLTLVSSLPSLPRLVPSSVFIVSLFTSSLIRAKSSSVHTSPVFSTLDCFINAYRIARSLHGTSNKIYIPISVPSPTEGTGNCPLRALNTFLNPAPCYTQTTRPLGPTL